MTETTTSPVLQDMLTDSIIDKVHLFREGWHQRRANLISLPPVEGRVIDPLHYAVNGHRYIGAVEAARRGDEEGLAYLRSEESYVDLTRQVLHTSSNLSVLLREWHAPEESPGVYGKVPPHSVTEMDDHVPDDLRVLVEATIHLAEEVGFGQLLQLTCGAVVLLRERAIDAIRQSWTISDLPCTIHSDYYRDPVMFGAELMHEAIHNWVNDVLAFAGLGFESSFCHEPRYWSPWKDIERPACAFLHTIMAFSTIVAYLQAVEHRTQSEQLQREVRRRCTEEARRLRLVENQVEQLLRTELRGHEEVGQGVLRAYREATAIVA